MDVLTNLSPTENQLVSGLGTNSASHIYHEWLTDTLESVKTNSYVEGVDASYPDLTDPTRLLNVTQIARQGYKVSDTERAVNTAAFSDRYGYEATKAMKVIKNDMEYALMRGSLACGSGTDTSRQLKGIKNWLSLVTNQSAASMSETDLNDYFQNVWDNGTEVNAIYAPMYMKRKISNFSGNSNYKTVESKDKRLINAVDIYEADAAKLVKLFAHRYVTTSGDIGANDKYDLVGINEDLFKIAYLRKPFSRELARTGDATKGEIVTEFTLECLHQHAGFLAENHL